MTIPAISIVVPLYNKAAYVGDALTSIAAQSFDDYEVIVVDDGSTDEGAEVVKRSGVPRLNLVQQANRGVAAARNRGIELAPAGLVAFLDADDTWNIHHLRHLHELHRRYPSAALYANDFVEQGKRNRTAAQQPGLAQYRLVDDYIAEAATGRAWVFTSAAMVRRDACLGLGGFAVGESRGEDLDLWIRLTLAHPVAVSDYIGCNYRRVSNSLTGRPVLAPDVAMRTIAQHLAEAGDLTACRQVMLRELYNRIALAHAADCLLHREIAAARHFLDLSRATRTQRRRWRALDLLVRSAAFGSIELVQFWRRTRACLMP